MKVGNAWKENNKVFNWRMRCFEVKESAKSLILKCCKAGKKHDDGSYPDPMYIDVIVTNNTQFNGDAPAKKNVLVSGSFQYSDYEGKPQFTVFAEKVKVDD